MTKNDLIHAFLHRPTVIYTPVGGEATRYQYIEAIEYTTDRFGVFKLGAVLRGHGNTITHVLAECVEIEDEKERNTRLCPLKMPASFEEFKIAFLKCRPVIVKEGGQDIVYPRITKLTVKLDYHGDITFTVTVGKNTETKDKIKPEDVIITSLRGVVERSGRK